MKKLLIFALSCVYLQLYAQVQPGTYTIKTKLVNRNMDVQWGNNANGTLLHLWDVNGDRAQNFTIENSNEASYYYIKTAWGRALDVYNSDRSSGAKLNTWDFNGSDAQKWKFVNTGDGYYNIQSKLGTFLDVKNGASEGGTIIWMSAYSNWNGNIAQRWKLERSSGGNGGTTNSRVMTRFNPSVHGFKFVNNFTVQTQIAGFNGPTFSGLCGGMVYSALDYFHAGMTIPQQNYMPAEGMPLQSYIWRRQQQSALPNADKWIEYGFNPFGNRNREFFNWGLQLGSGRLGELMSKIDRGEPVPLGLQSCGNDCRCPNGNCPGSHQVLAIGYEMGRYRGDLGANIEDLSIFVYDPNYPNRTMTLRPDVNGAMYLYREESQLNNTCRWRAYFTDMRYTRTTPPTISNLPNELVARFVTGGDDLRGGNDNVNLVLLLRSGTPLRFDNVNERRRWVDNSTQNISKPLPSNLRRGDIVGVRIEFTGSGGMGGDNWNLDKLTITLRNETLPIFNQEGHPLVRFTGDNRAREFRF